MLDIHLIPRYANERARASLGSLVPEPRFESRRVAEILRSESQRSTNFSKPNGTCTVSMAMVDRYAPFGTHLISLPQTTSAY